jgi:glucose/arabinose dehydrogenase
MIRNRVLIALATLALLLSVGLGLPSRADDPPGPTEPIDDPIPGHIERGDIQVQLQTLTQGRGLTAPNWGTFAPGQPNILYVSDQDGPLWAVDINSGAKTVFLNTRAFLVPLGAFGPGTFDERGFLGVAFHPQYATNGLLYTYTSELPGNPSGQPNHTSVIREWRVPNPTANPLATRTNNDQGPGVSGATVTRIVMSFVQPQFNHNGGCLFFGTRPDDRHLLYITSGDGGCADDQNGQLGLQGEGPCIGHGPGSEATSPNRFGNGQSLNTPLGKILRIDPLAASPTPLSEAIYAYGFRNPFRGSSDRVDLGGTGDIWTADAGQNHIEEVDGRVRQGGNYGWHFKEGRWLFNPFFYELLGFASDGFPFAFSPGSPPDMIDPDAEYDHDEGVAVVGGFVYRGQRIGELRGHYVFGDYSRRPNNGNGEVFYLDENDRADPRDRTPKIFHLTNGPINVFVLGFGEDRRGELYVMANKTGIPFEETGIVMKVVRRCADNTECRD